MENTAPNGRVPRKERAVRRGGRTARNNLRRGGKLSGFGPARGRACPWGASKTRAVGLGSYLIPLMKRRLRRAKTVPAPWLSARQDPGHIPRSPWPAAPGDAVASADRDHALSIARDRAGCPVGSRWRQGRHRWSRRPSGAHRAATLLVRSRVRVRIMVVMVMHWIGSAAHRPRMRDA